MLASREMPGARWFPGAEVNYAEHMFRGKADDAVAIRHASELRELGEWTWGDLRRETARIRAGLVALGVGGGDRVGRLHAEHPRDDRGVPGDRVARRDLVERRARVRRAQRHRPLRADRAEGAAGGRRLPLRRQGLRPRETVEGIAAEIGAELVRFGYLDGSGWQDGFLGDAGELEFERVALRPPAVGPLLLGHDRAAEGDRPRPGRDPARAPQEDAPARRRAGRRPRLLVHDDRLDDVELPRRRAAHRRLDRALRRQPGRRGRCGTSPPTPGSRPSAPAPPSSPRR